MYNIFLPEPKHNFIASDNIQIYHINLDYLRQIDYNDNVIKENKLMKDLYFLICGRDKLEVVYERVDEIMKDIIDESKKIAGFEKMHLYLTDEEMLELDKKHYIEVGREEGREEKMHEMIIKMHNKNIDLNIISELTNLSIKEIEKIINKK